MSADIPPTPPGSAASPNRILIADDDETILGFCRAALGQVGYSLSAVATAEDALHALRDDGPFDLLLVDIQMPGMSGLELAELARAADPTLVVVVMTGHTSEETLRGAVSRGVANFLSKPFEVGVLQLTVAQALHQRRLQQGSMRARDLEGLLASSEALNASLDLEQICQTILAEARRHIPSAAGFILLAAADGPARLIADPPAARLSELGQQAAAALALPPPGAQPLAELAGQPLSAALVAPLRARDEPIGAIMLCDPRPDLASPGAQEILGLLANQAGNALHNAQLFGRLQQAYDGLRELDRLKGEFIAIASHELRSPLAIIMGYARMARDRSEGEAQLYAQRSLDGAERIKQIVDDLMRLHSFDQRRAGVSREPIALDELLRQTAERLAPEAQQQRQTISLELSEQPWPIETDREKLQMAAGNLIANAIRFTPAGGQISVATARWAQDQVAQAVASAAPNPSLRGFSAATAPAWAVIQVRDTGIGIAREQQSRIFDRFAQVAPSLTRDHGGTGLGLAIVCEIVSLLGGAVWVESALGAGSRFYLALPELPAGP